MISIFNKLFLLLLFFNAQIIFTQWQPDYRLTNNPGNSNTSGNNARCIASSGSTSHIVWFDNRDGNNEIYYKRSTDDGSSWGADTRLTNNSSGSEYASVTVSGLSVHTVWRDNRDGNWEIYYKRSTDGGTSWIVDTRLTNNSAESYNPSASVSGSEVHVVWRDNRDGNYEVYYRRSTDGGVTWGAETRLTANSAWSNYPSVSTSGQSVHVVWHDNRDGNWEIYYKRSTDGGSGWSADMQLTNTPADAYDPTVSVTGQSIHIVWTDIRDGNPETYYKRSTDGGISWGSDTRLTNINAQKWYPSIFVSGLLVHVVWYDERAGNPEMFYRRSLDGGVSWGTEIRLTNNPGDSYNPSISVSGQTVHLVWKDNRDGNNEIYYKRDPSGNVNALSNISTEIPEKFNLLQNYPNPFNPKTVISFQLPATSFAALKIYDLLGREVETLVNEQLMPGTYEADWDASAYTSGVYFYKLKTDSYSESKKMILIK